MAVRSGNDNIAARYFRPATMFSQSGQTGADPIAPNRFNLASFTRDMVAKGCRGVGLS